jgi:hypothetical protein
LLAAFLENPDIAALGGSGEGANCGWVTLTGTDPFQRLL